MRMKSFQLIAINLVYWIATVIATQKHRENTATVWIFNKASLYSTTLNNAMIRSLSEGQQVTFERATQNSDVYSQEQQITEQFVCPKVLSNTYKSPRTSSSLILHFTKHHNRHFIWITHQQGNGQPIIPAKENRPPFILLTQFKMVARVIWLYVLCSHFRNVLIREEDPIWEPNFSDTKEEFCPNCL